MSCCCNVKMADRFHATPGFTETAIVLNQYTYYFANIRNIAGSGRAALNLQKFVNFSEDFDFGPEKKACKVPKLTENLFLINVLHLDNLKTVYANRVSVPSRVARNHSVDKRFQLKRPPKLISPAKC